MQARLRVRLLTVKSTGRDVRLQNFINRLLAFCNFKVYTSLGSCLLGAGLLPSSLAPLALGSRNGGFPEPQSALLTTC